MEAASGATPVDAHPGAAVVESQAVEAPAAVGGPAAEPVPAAPPAAAAADVVLETDREFALRHLRRIADEDSGFDGGVQLRACELILVLGAGGTASVAAIAR